MRTDEENRLSEWLRQNTPQPPRDIRLEDVSARITPQHRPIVRWAPVLAAVCVAALVAVIVVVAQGPHPTAPSGPGTPTQLLVPVPGAPWSGNLTNAGALDDDSLAAANGSLYAFGFYSGQFLQRLDPATGRVLATATAPDGVLVDGPVLAGGAVWAITTPLGSPHVMLYSYDPATLRVRTSRALSLPGLLDPDTQLTLTAPADGSRLYVGGGSAIETIDLRTGGVGRSVDSTGTVRAVSVTPDGSVLYVALAGGVVVATDPATGTVVRSVTPIHDSVDALRATASGVFVAEDTGPGSRVVFSPAGRSGVLVPVRRTSGPVAPHPTLSGGVAWVGGTGRLVCADPATGVVRASASVPRRVIVSGVSVLAGHVYAEYHAVGTVTEPSGVIELHPPKACGLS